MPSSPFLPSRNRFALETVAALISGVFGEKRPADRWLNSFFRDHRQCGSNDRRLISEAGFGVFRHWGILRKALPEERRKAVESGEPLTPAETRLLVAGALEKEHRFPEIAAQLRRETGDYRLEGAPEENYPAWIVEHLPPDFPFCKFGEMLAKRPPMWLRMQCDAPLTVLENLRRAGLGLECFGEKFPDAVAVRDSPVNLFTLPDFRNGLFEVQDLASQAIGAVAAPRPGERWFDACAGAGGKTLQLATLLRRRGEVVASDIRAYKLDDLKLRARRAGFPNIRTRPWDGKPLEPRKRGKFDGVLVDAPCSCSGVWRRNPDSRWNLTADDIASAAALQFEILENACTAVKPGGILVYATCSLFPAENGGVVERFLAAHPEFKLDPFSHPLTGAVCPGMMQIAPGEFDCDSMFAARMRKSC